MEIWYNGVSLYIGKGNFEKDRAGKFVCINFLEI